MMVQIQYTILGCMLKTAANRSESAQVQQTNKNQMRLKKLANLLDFAKALARYHTELVYV
jgi:hypothetical protein